MKRKKFPFSWRKFIRREKMRFRRTGLDAKDKKQAIGQLYENKRNIPVSGK
jgi:hypothetical protein